mgnify:CR=1 FL=1
MSKNLIIPLVSIAGIGPKRAKAFAKRGIKTIEDLCYYFPRRYEDRRKLIKISQLIEGEIQTVRGTVLAVGQRRSFKRWLTITEVAVGDASGKIFCVWFSQPYLKNYFKPGKEIILYGRVERYGKRLQLNAPEFEFIEDEVKDLTRIIPIYPAVEGTSQRYLRRLIEDVLDEYLPSLHEILPYNIRTRHNLFNLAKSLRVIHFPGDENEQKEAYRRLSFEEFFIFQIPILLRKLRYASQPGITHQSQGKLASLIQESLPFRLTSAQLRVWEEIKLDLASSKPMHRLIQGDVGSGKTIVAFLAGFFALEGGHQVAFMVPTDILARQHYENIRGQEKIKISLLTSSLDKKEKTKIYKEIKEGKIDLIIGTHALLEEGVKFKNLGLVVIDEQHKFGVSQRALLPQKGNSPDILIMTATPIPRTLAITLYGDLDISIIDELPPGRKPIKTLWLELKERKIAYDLCLEQLKSGCQAYIVYPVIEDSYILDIAGAKKMYAQLKEGIFRGVNIGLIHGRMKQKEQEEVMQDFKEKKLSVLVSTTIVEVGLDIPTATCMIIEHAERFGLAQLHQLRGRVGRGEAESFCVLLSDAYTMEAQARMTAMKNFSDGFKIAEEDLRIRGPGEFFGERQHGLSELRIANPLTQLHLLKAAREEAKQLLKADPNLEESAHLPLREKLLQRFPEYEKLTIVG